MRAAISTRAAASRASAAGAGLRPRGGGMRGLASLSKEYDVVIAGGGVIGASTAYHTKLANPDMKICVVERDASYKAASATLSAGGMRQQFSVATNIHMSKYGVEFLRNVETLLAVEGQDVPDVQFKENGYLLLASEAGEATLRANVDTQRAAGVDWTTLLTPDELESRFPWINTEDVTLGCFGTPPQHAPRLLAPPPVRTNSPPLNPPCVHLEPPRLRGGPLLAPPFGTLAQKKPHLTRPYTPTAFAGEHSEGWFDPWALLVALSAKSKDMGVDFVYGNVAGLGVDTDASGEASISSVEVLLKDGTTRKIGAGTVVNAAGPFAANIVRMGGDMMADLPVRARKRCLFNFEVRKRTLTHFPKENHTA